MTGKIHIAGVPKNGKQLCTRCHTRLNNPPYDDGVYWPAQQAVYMTRYGSSNGHHSQAEFRNCGRREAR